MPEQFLDRFLTNAFLWISELSMETDDVNMVRSVWLICIVNETDIGPQFLSLVHKKSSYEFNFIIKF